MELKDRVQEINGLIRDLRQSAGDGRKSRDLLDSLFRAVHSFKAAAAAEGRHDVSSAAHEFENFLHVLRTGQLPLDDEVLETCEHNAARLLDGSRGYTYDSFTITEIDKVRSHPLLPAEFSTLRDEERHRATSAVQEGSNLYVMEAVFEASDFDARFRQLKGRLAEVGELISTSATMQDDKIIFQVVYASRTEQILVQTVLRQSALAGKAIAATLNKKIEFVVRGEECLVDHRWSDVLTDALLHLVRNAVDHGIESQGTVVLEASTTPNATLITVTDNGRGIDPVNLPQVFQLGFTTAQNLTELSGRGFGLDIVATIIKDAGGSVSVTSEPGKGSSFQIMIPNPISGA